MLVEGVLTLFRELRERLELIEKHPGWGRVNRGWERKGANSF